MLGRAATKVRAALGAVTELPKCQTDLHFKLAQFVPRPRVQGDTFINLRLTQLETEIDEYARLASQVHERADVKRAVHAIYYTRFYVSLQFARLDPHFNAAVPIDMNYALVEQFKRHAGLAIAPDITYKVTVLATFENMRHMRTGADLFLAAEKEMFAMLRGPNAQFARDHFEAYNLQVLPYVEDCIDPVLRRLTKAW